MATVTGFTAERMLEIEQASVVDGNVAGNDLILVTRGGTQINAGNVRGPKGDQGVPGPLTQAQADTLYVNVGGDTMTGPLLVPNGTIASHVVNKGQLDLKLDSSLANTTYVKKTGDDMTGNLTIDGGSGANSPLYIKGSSSGPYITCLMPDGTRRGYLGRFSAAMRIVSEGGEGIILAAPAANDVVINPCNSVRIGDDPENVTAGGLRLRSGGQIYQACRSAVFTTAAFQLDQLAASGNHLIRFTYNNGSTAGAIILQSSTSVSYATTSDYRIKDEEGPVPNPLDRINQLRPIRFKYKENPELGSLDGFFAHEVDEIVPGAVTGEKDAIFEADEVDVIEGGVPAGTVKPQQLDYSRLVPLLVASVQELTSKVSRLEQDLALLTSGGTA